MNDGEKHEVQILLLEVRAQCAYINMGQRVYEPSRHAKATLHLTQCLAATTIWKKILPPETYQIDTVDD